MLRSWRTGVCLAGTLSFTACFNAAIADDATIACGGNADCPTPLVCASLVSRCVAPDGDRTAPAVASSTLSARRIGAAGRLDVDVVTDEPILDGSLLQVGAATIALTLADPATGGRAGIDAAALDGEGVYPVSVLLVDIAGNLGAAVLGTLEVDATAPAIEDGSLTVVVQQPAGTATVADPPLAPGGTIDVRFRLDDLAAVVDRVALVNDSGEDIAIGFINRTSNAWHFALAFDDAVADGPRSLVVDARDDVGNVARLVVASVDVVGSIVDTCVALDEAGAPLCTDADGDGFFGPGEGCAVGQATDCDDTRTLVFPGAVEVAGDDIDDDCDGTLLSFDDAEAEGRAIFVAPDAPVDAAGTRTEPVDLVVAAARAATQRATLHLQAGTYALPDDRVFLHGSMVGGYGPDWQPGSTRTTLVALDPVAFDADTSGNLATPPLLLRSLDLRGVFCIAVIAPPEGPLFVGDLDVENEDSNCTSVTAFLVSGPVVRLVDSRIRLVSTGTGDARGVNGGTDVRVIDTTIELDALSGGAIGVGSPETGLVARSRISVRGDEVIAVQGALDVVNSHLQVFGRPTRQIFFGDGGLAGDGVFAHNTIEVDGEPGTRLFGVSSNGGVIVANDVVVRGHGDAAAIRLEDFRPVTAALHHNRIALEGGGCVVGLGRTGATCVSPDDCSVCGASVGNTVAPASPAPVSAIALGAPSTTAIDVDGACRPAVSGPGAQAAQER